MKEELRRAEQESIGESGESRLAAVLISPFGAKYVSLGRRLSVLGWLSKNQVSPDIQASLLCSLLSRNRTSACTYLRTRTIVIGGQANCCCLHDNTERVKLLNVCPPAGS